MLSYIQEELDRIKSFDTFHQLEYMFDNLLNRATGGSFEDNIYKSLRLELLRQERISAKLPNFINECRTIDQFWSFIKNRYSTYSERREFLREQFNPLLSELELANETPIEETLVFDITFINKEWQKALNRKYSDPEAAITSARTLIETICKYILDEQDIIYDDSADLPDLYKKTAKSLNLAPELHEEGIFKQILGGAFSVVQGLGSLRNKLGDAHGKSSKRIKPSDRHSEFAVNMAGALTLFLLRTYEEKF